MIRTVRTILCTAMLGLLVSIPLGAQEVEPPTLRGRVIDPQGQPVAGIVVAVHRVSEVGGGGEVGRAATAEDGAFDVPLDTSEDGIYFAATRYEGALYMGGMFRELDEVTSDYVIVVGQNAVAGGGPAVVPPPDPGPGATWPVLLVLGVVGGVFVLLPLMPKRRRHFAVRSLLLELAELEERGAAGDTPSQYPAEREALRARIREISQSAS